MSKASLDEVKSRLLQRYREKSKEKRAGRVKAFSPADLIEDSAEKLIIAILTELGIDHPIDFHVPPPDVDVACRQGIFELAPTGATVNLYPEIPLSVTDTETFTFKARDGRFLIIHNLDFIAEEEIAERFVTISYKFDQQNNTINHQIVKSPLEKGHWKFNRIVLVDGGELTVTVANTFPDSSAFVGIESCMWQI